MAFKIHETSTSLCDGCKWAAILKGRGNQRLVSCSWYARDVHFDVEKCSVFLPMNHPTVNEMEATAWILKTNPKRSSVGFVSPEERKRDGNLYDRPYPVPTKLA